MTKSEKAKEYLEKRRYLGLEIACLDSLQTMERNNMEYLNRVYQIDISKSESYKEFMRLLEQRKADLETELRTLSKLINRLPDERCRAVLKLYYIDGLTFSEIADCLFYGIRAVFTRYAKALEAVADLCGFHGD